MDSNTFWEENSVRNPVKYESCNSDDASVPCQLVKEEQRRFQYCDGNLNFSTVATSEDDEFSFHKKKISRDPMSHRIIEKRRRDRMNNCLADLSRLIPADYLKKGRGRIEKTEIIEMAIKHMKHLQTRTSKDTDCGDSDQTPSQEETTDSSSPPIGSYCSVGTGPIITEHYRLGYQECLSEAMHFMVEVEGFYAGDPLCVQLINHLQKHCDKILKGDRLNFPRTHVNETTSNSSGSSGSFPHHMNNAHSASGSPNSGESSSDYRNDSSKDERSNLPLCSQMDENCDDVVDLTSRSQLRDMLTSPNLLSHNQTVPKRNFTPMSTGSLSNQHEMNSSVASLYKFKNNIKQRFSAEHVEENSLSKRRRYELPTEMTRRNSDTFSVPSSPPPSPDRPLSPTPKPNNVPIFALHAKGSYYVPLTLDAEILAPYFNEINLSENTSKLNCDVTTLVLHPVTISVNFKQSNHHRFDAKPSKFSPSNLIWKNEPNGFSPLPNWYHNEVNSSSTSPYSKNL